MRSTGLPAIACTIALCVYGGSAAAAGSSRQEAPPPSGSASPPAAAQQPPAPSPEQAGQAPAPAGQQPATPPAPAPARTFTAPVGLLFNTVRADRTADFERVVAYLQATLAASADPTIRAQAAGWRTFKAAEPGPNGTVLYVFLLDPTVPGADYSLGPILADAFPDAAPLQEIWKLYQGAVTTGGSLLNLIPVMPPPPDPAAPVPSPADPAAPAGTTPVPPPAQTEPTPGDVSPGRP